MDLSLMVRKCRLIRCENRSAHKKLLVLAKNPHEWCEYHGREQDVWSQYEGRDLQELVFARIPSHLDIHSLRREYAQNYYRVLSGRELPPATGRLKPGDYDLMAVMAVSRALGHNRKDVVLRHYLR